MTDRVCRVKPGTFQGSLHSDNESPTCSQLSCSTLLVEELMGNERVTLILEHQLELIGLAYKCTSTHIHTHCFAVFSMFVTCWVGVR